MPFPVSWYPREIIVRDTVYTVKFVKSVGRKNWIGYCDCDTQTLYICKWLKPARRFGVFCHELFHAIEHEWGFTFNHKTLERQDRYIGAVIAANLGSAARSKRGPLAEPKPPARSRTAPRKTARTGRTRARKKPR